MKKNWILFSLLLTVGSFSVSAQSLVKTSWRGYYGDPINDTITIHYLKDSSYVTSSKGDTLVVSKNYMTRDTVKIADIGGQYQCPPEGTYTYVIKGNTLHFILVSDDCEGRQAIQDIIWTRVVEMKKKK